MSKFDTAIKATKAPMDNGTSVSEKLQHMTHEEQIAAAKQILTSEFLISVLEEVKKERSENERLRSIIDFKDQEILEADPEISYWDIILETRDPQSVSVIARHYGMTEEQFNCKLCELGVQSEKKGNWLLNGMYTGYGYTDAILCNVKGNAFDWEMKWTQKGRLFLYDLLKSNGILPLIERNEFEVDSENV